jgi:hypothetical protein
MSSKPRTSNLTCEAVAPAALGEPRPGRSGDGRELYFTCNQHQDDDPSLKVNPDKKCWMDGPCGVGGGPWDLACFVLGKGAKWELLSESDKREVTAWLREHGLLAESAASRKKGEAKTYPVLREFIYRDADGKPLAKRTRHDVPESEKGNRFKWWHLEKGQWASGCSFTGRLPVYIGLPEPRDEQTFFDRKKRIEAGEETIYFTEGEHDADAGAQIGLLTVTSGGTSTIENVKRSAEMFRGKEMVIVAHPGGQEAKFSQEVAATLNEKGISVKIIKPAEFWPIGDVKDLADIVEGISIPGDGYGVETIQHTIGLACQHAKEWKPAGGAELLDATYAFIRKFAKVTEAQARALAPWIAAAFIYRKWHYTAYIHIYSAERGEGKSTLLDVLAALLGVDTVHVRPTLAALFTDLDEHPGTAQLLDEIDKMLTGKKSEDDPILSYLTAGFQKGRTVLRTVIEHGKRYNVKFETFCPKVFAGRFAEVLDDATRDRCIPVRMERASWEDHVKRFVPKFHIPEGREIGAKLRVWCESIAEQASKVVIPCTVKVTQRVIDMWEPLLAVATLAGSDWLSWTKWSLIELHTGAEAEHDSKGMILLKGIRPIRKASTEPEGIHTVDLIAKLHAEGGEFLEWGRAQKPITDQGIARILTRYGARHRKISYSAGQRLWGYAWSDLDKLFALHIPLEDCPETSPGRESPISLVNQGDTRETGKVAVEACNPEKEMTEKGIKWFPITELRAMWRAQKHERKRISPNEPSPLITVIGDPGLSPELPGGFIGLKAVGPGGRETAMIERQCERWPLALDCETRSRK